MKQMTWAEKYKELSGPDLSDIILDFPTNTHV